MQQLRVHCSQRADAAAQSLPEMAALAVPDCLQESR
jgi:hypothetical protein